jgi:iron(III) transport system ATP-binding protein
MNVIRLEHLTKSFGQTRALDDVDLEVKAGELFFLLGPSGCGKTTVLRLIAGLLAPDKGSIVFNSRDVTALSTAKRNAVMVFQSYALWPHMTVSENVRFGLAARRTKTSEQRLRIKEVLQLVQMEELAHRRPGELSGGQQQRVALARAIAVKPACLLLDEPLSNLDARLRNEMRGEIKRICKETGITTIYVTHDQKEALGVADRIAVMRNGKVIQIGAPDEIYRRPQTRFVAEFLGQTNLLPARVLERKGPVLRVETPIGRFLASGEGDFSDNVTVSIRPEQMRIIRDGELGIRVQNEADMLHGKNQLIGELVSSTFLGEVSEHVLVVSNHRLKLIAAPPLREIPDEVAVEFDAEDVVVVKDET